MHICFVNSNIEWGGGERWTHQFACLARDNGHEVMVLANKGSTLAKRMAKTPNIRRETMRLGNLSFLNPLTLLRLARLFDSVDVVLMSLPRDLKAAGIAAKWAHVKRIIYRRGIDIPVKNNFLNRYLYAQILTGLICNTEATKRSVLINNEQLIVSKRICVVNNAFDVAEFDARPAIPMPECQENISIIGCAARLTPQKGINLLLDAVALLKKRGYDFQLMIAGSGAQEAKLKAQAKRLNLSKHVKFLGFVEDIKSFYAAIDILALPSLFEGFGYVLIEAGRCGKPAVAFDVSSNPEIILHEQTGLLAKKINAKSLADQLERLLQDPKLTQTLGQAAQKHALSFDTAVKYQEFELALQQLDPC